MFLINLFRFISCTLLDFSDFSENAMCVVKNALNLYFLFTLFAADIVYCVFLIVYVSCRCILTYNNVAYFLIGSHPGHINIRLY